MIFKYRNRLLAMLAQLLIAATFAFGLPQYLGAQAERQPIPELAPLQRIIPPIESFTIIYQPTAIAFTAEMEQRLSNLALRLRDTDDVILLTGFAGDAQLSTHEAVRLSFARTMMIRAFLIRHGVDGNQVDLKALAQATDDGPRDRVDIKQINR